MKFGKYEAEKREGTYNDVVGIKQWVIGFKNGYEASVLWIGRQAQACLLVMPMHCWI